HAARGELRRRRPAKTRRKELRRPRAEHGGLAGLAEDHGGEARPERAGPAQKEGGLRQREAHEEDGRRAPPSDPIGEMPAEPEAGQAHTARDDDERARLARGPPVPAHRPERGEGEAGDVVAHAEEEDGEPGEHPSPVGGWESSAWGE